ncbi:MAG: DUF308 domain-containing protein [Pleomorphochaeta sp.]
MKKVNFFKKNLFISMIFGILISIFGVVLLFQGEEFVSFVVLLYGIYSVYIGVRGLTLSTRLTANERRTKNVTLFSSIFSIVIGIIIIIYPYFTTTLAVNVVVYLLAIQLLISGLNNLFSSIGLRNTNFYSSSYLAQGIINLAIAVIFFLFPGQVAQFFLSIFGILCILYGLIHFFWSYRIRKVEKDFEKTNIEGEFEKID